MTRGERLVNLCLRVASVGHTARSVVNDDGCIPSPTSHRANARADVSTVLWWAQNRRAASETPTWKRTMSVGRGGLAWVTVEQENEKERSKNKLKLCKF